MPTQKPPYDHAGAERLLKHVEQQKQERYGQLKGTAWHIYSLGVPRLEMAQQGLCCAVTANYREIAQMAFVTYQRLREHLDALTTLGLIELVVGEEGRKNASATQLRRRTIEELRTGAHGTELCEIIPAAARQVSEILNARPFRYGTAADCLPHWAPKATGRIYSSRPHVQGDKEQKRVQQLREGLQDGQTLLCADYSQAEPTVVQHLLKAAGLRAPLPQNPYKTLAKLLGTSREDAKRKLNTLAYSRGSRRIVDRLELPADSGAVFIDYADDLDQLKQRLVNNSHLPKRYKGTAISLTTASGAQISRRADRRPHGGQLLSWIAQATIAEALNGAILELCKDDHGPRFIFPVHDAVYCASDQPDRDSKFLRDLLRSTVAPEDLHIGVEVKEYRG